MNLPFPTGFSTFDGVAAWARAVITAIGAAWNAQHRADGSHAFPWVRATNSALSFTPWTVTTVARMKYRVVDKSMLLVFDVTGTLATTPSAVSFTIPGGYRAAVESVAAGTFQYTDAGTPGVGDAIANDTQIDCYKNINGTAWSAGTARVRGSIEFEVR